MSDNDDSFFEGRKKRFPATIEPTAPAPTRTRKLWETVSQVRKNSVADIGLSQVTSSGNKSPTVPSIQKSTISEKGMTAARQKMIQRLRQQGVGSEQVLRAMNVIHREDFIDSALANQAYEDTSLPIGLGQTISKPSIVARMVDLLMPANGVKLNRVLDVGTGCGYQAAVLSELVHEVYSIERLRGLHERARVNLRPLRLKNVHLIYGDGMLGFPSGAPYDAIIAAAGGDHIPTPWLEQLAENGCLIAPILSKHGVQSLIKVVRTKDGWIQHELETVQFVPLKSGVL